MVTVSLKSWPVCLSIPSIILLSACQNMQPRQIDDGPGHSFVSSYSVQLDALIHGHDRVESIDGKIKKLQLGNHVATVFDLPSTGDYRYFSSPNIINVDGKEYLYYVASAKFWGAKAQLLRIPLNPLMTTSADVVKLPASYGAYSLSRMLQLTNKQLAIVFRAGRSQLHFSQSADGLNFTKPVVLATGTMPALAQFADSRLVFTFQQGAAIDAMRGVLRFSTDNGLSWSEPVALPHPGDVHDLAPVRRPDGLVDIYYIARPPKHDRYSLYRICYRGGAQFGKAEALLPDYPQDVAKPALLYTRHGRLLTFSQTNNGFTVNSYRAMVSLKTDANCETS